MLTVRRQLSVLAMSNVNSKCETAVTYVVNGSLLFSASANPTALTKKGDMDEVCSAVP
jgi:hypothetical protein